MENPTFVARPWRTSPNDGRWTSAGFGAVFARAAVAAAFVMPSAAVRTKKHTTAGTHHHSLRARTT